MMEKENSAGRIYRLFSNNYHKQSGVQVLQGWSEAFELPSDLSSNDLAFEISSLLSVVDTELRIVQDTLLSKGIPEGLVVPYVERARHAVAPTLLTATWNSVTQYLGSDTQLAFQWFAYEMDADACVISSAESSELLKQIAELESYLKSSLIPSGLRQFLLSHLKAMQTAIRQARVSGVKPLQKVVRATQHDCEMDSDHIQRDMQGAQDKKEARKAGESFCKIWKKAAEMCGDAEKFQKAGKILGESMAALLTYVSG